MHPPLSLIEYKKHFIETDFAYLEQHYPRIAQTRELIVQGISKNKLDIIDIGAHWLHQTLLFALDGHRVTAADLPFALSDKHVQELAIKNRIVTYTYDDLSNQTAFDGINSNSFDVILFTEIIEHLTFNPVDMWKGMYRILKPRGKIIVTTPNYYYLGQVVKRSKRILKRLGGGISVDDVLKLKTMGPHWKEYSAKELTQYFQILSRDFKIDIIKHCPSPVIKNTNTTVKRKTIHLIEKILPIFRSGLYMEINLPEKKYGIEVEPSW